MRRIVIFVTLVVILVSFFRLSLLVRDWHYIVPAPSGQLVYVASFDEGIDDWELSPFRQEATWSDVADGVIQLYVGSAPGGIYSSADPYMSNFDVEADVRSVNGPFNGAGLIFRQRDRDNYYLFLITGDGYYRVERVLDGRQRIVHNWHLSPAINLGMAVTNRLRVVGSENRFRFYVNGQRLELCIPNNPQGESTPLVSGDCMDGTWVDTWDDKSIPYGRVGVALEIDVRQPAESTVEFDNFVVYGPRLD